MDLASKRVEMGQRIERARADRQLSIEGARAELATAIGAPVSRFTWMRWERGSPLPAELVLPLARVLDVDPVWLLGGHARTIRSKTTARATA